MAETQRIARAADAIGQTDLVRPPRKAQVLTVARGNPLHVVQPDSATQVRTGQAHTRLGVLDIGSNTAQLQVVDLRRGAPPLPAYAVKQPTRLAEDIDADGAISPAGIDRLAEATGPAMHAAREHGVEQLYVFATAAIRDAANRGEVIDIVERAAGVRPQFLSGEDEARLTYLAVHRWYGWSANRVLLIDIGGGSMEIVLGRDAEPDLAVSVPLGAGRLTRAFLPDDPLSRAQLKALREHIRDTVREVTDRVRWKGPPSRAIATSKTFKQLARLTGCAPQRKGPFVRRTLDGDDLATWIPELARRSAAERAKLRGISPARCRQVLAGALLAKLTMSALDIKQVEICPGRCVRASCSTTSKAKTRTGAPRFTSYARSPRTLRRLRPNPRPADSFSRHCPDGAHRRRALRRRGRDVRALASPEPDLASKHRGHDRPETPKESFLQIVLQG